MKIQTYIYIPLWCYFNGNGITIQQQLSLFTFHYGVTLITKVMIAFYFHIVFTFHYGVTLMILYFEGAGCVPQFTFHYGVTLIFFFI